MEPLRLLLADDSPLFRKGLSGLFESTPDFQVVGEARDGVEALEKARELLPDVILMDINMPRCNGLEATRLIKEELPYIRIVMLTVSDSEQHLFEAIKVGAQGYLLKNLEPEELFQMLRAVSRGEAPISPAMAGKILKEFTHRYQPAPAPEAESSPLTAREKDILQLVVLGQANKEIANQLNIAESTVKNHLRNIMEKLHAQNRVQAAIQALQKGGITLSRDRTEKT